MRADMQNSMKGWKIELRKSPRKENRQIQGKPRSSRVRMRERDTEKNTEQMEVIKSVSNNLRVFPHPEEHGL